MEIDTFLLDRLAQPLVDRLARWWTPFTAGRTVFLAGVAALAADWIARLAATPTGALKGWVLVGLMTAPAIAWTVLIALARAERDDRGCANSLRLGFRLPRLLWLGLVAFDGVVIVAHGRGQVPTTLAAGLICAGLYLASCQTRPPRQAPSRMPHHTIGIS